MENNLMSSLRRALARCRLLMSSSIDNVNFVNALISTGTQYINTGYYPDHNHKYEMSLLDEDIGTYENYFGTSNTDVRVLRGALNNIIFSYTNDTTYKIDSNIITKIFIDKNIFYVNNLQVGSHIPLVNPNTKHTHPLLIFLSYYANHIDKYGIFKLYYFKVWDGEDNLVFDLHPALDESSVPCLYDLISKQYLYNAGTGQFLYEQILE